MAYAGQPTKINTTAFGEMSAAEAYPQIQLEFPLGIDPNLIVSYVTNVGTVTSSPPFALVQSGPSAISSAYFQSARRLHAQPGQGVSAMVSALFTSGIDGSQQYIGLGDSYNGFFFGWNGATFGILYRQEVYGASPSSAVITDTWIYQNGWSSDPFNGTGGTGVTLNPSLGNVYKIQMQWMGFGVVNFFILNPNTGKFVLAHQIQNLNSSLNTTIAMPTLPLFALALNTSNTTNVVLQIPALSAFIEGQLYQSPIRYSIFGNNNGMLNDNLVLSIQNMYTFNGVLNRKEVLLDSVSLWNQQANLPIVYRFCLNPLLSTSSYVTLSATTSVVQYYSPGSVTVSLTRQTNTRTLLYIYAPAVGQVNLSLGLLGIYLEPGDTLAVSSSTIGSASSSNCSLSWTEQF